MRRLQRNTEVQKENFIYKVKTYVEEFEDNTKEPVKGCTIIDFETGKTEVVKFKDSKLISEKTVLECTTIDLKTGKTEVVKFEAISRYNCLTKQLRKAKGKISREMLNVAYNFIMDELDKLKGGSINEKGI